MTDRHLVVALGETRVGSIRPERDGRASFRFDEEYRRMPARPVLGQWFEDDLGKVRVHRRRTLLPWFENLLPEGDLRRSVCKARGIDEGDDLGVLALLGQDLPGAVVVGPSTQAVTFEDEAFADVEVEAEREVDVSAPALRFSLAGVQLKLSMSRRDDRWILPMSGIGGEWIAKIPWTERFPGLAENEYSTMQWAKLAGFMVPECELTTMASLGGVPATLRAGRPESLSVFAIRRYDRVAGTRIHQEDLAQVLAVTPEQKYEHITYEKLGPPSTKGGSGGSPSEPGWTSVARGTSCPRRSRGSARAGPTPPRGSRSLSPIETRCGSSGSGSRSYGMPAACRDATLRSAEPPR